MSKVEIAGGRRLFWVLLVGACILAVLPIWMTTVPPLHDFPTHLARAHILTTYAQSPELQRFYLVHWVPVPNLAIDLIVGGLSHVMPLYAAGKMFVSMIVLLWITGPVVLHYALYRRLDLWPLAASFFAFNAAATWGLVNYVFGAGFFFFALAAWIATEQTGVAKRVVMLSTMCFLLFFCHLGGLALYAFSVGILELARLRSTLANPKENIVRRWIPAAAQFVVPAAIFLFLTPTGPRYGSGGLTATDFAFPTIGHIAHGLRSPAFIELGSIDYVALIAVLAVAAYGILSGRLRFHPRLIPVLAALGVVSFLSIIVIVDQNQFVPNVRTMPVFASLCIACTAWTAAPARRIALPACLLIVGAFVARQGVMIDHWRFYDRQFTEFRDSLKIIPKGAMILSALAEKPVRQPPRFTGSGAYPYDFMIDLAVIERDAFTPMMFLEKELQPVESQDAYEDLNAHLVDSLPWEKLPEYAGASAPKDHYESGWAEHYDYLVAIHPAGEDNSLQRYLTKIHEGSFFSIFKVNKPGAETSKPPGG